MLVGERMTRNPVTISDDTNIDDAECVKDFWTTRDGI